jgi:hypothetical protein
LTSIKFPLGFYGRAGGPAGQAVRVNGYQQLDPFHYLSRFVTRAGGAKVARLQNANGDVL